MWKILKNTTPFSRPLFLIGSANVMQYSSAKTAPIPDEEQKITKRANTQTKSFNSSANSTFTPLVNYMQDWGDWMDPFKGVLGTFRAKKLLSGGCGGNIKGSKIDLHGINLGHEYYKEVVGLLQDLPPFIDNIDLSANSLGEKRVFPLKQIFAAFTHNIKELNLSCNDLGKLPAETFAALLEQIDSKLHTLDLSHNELGKMQGNSLAIVFAAISKSVRNLIIVGNDFENMPIADLTAALKALDPKIANLDLRYSKLGTMNVKDLCALVAAVPAETLNLRNNELSKLTAQDLAAVVAAISPAVQTLDVTFNSLEKYSTEELLEIIAAIKPSLKKIILHGNFIGSSRSPDDMLKIVTAFSEKLESIDLSYTSIKAPYQKEAEFYFKLLDIAAKFKDAKLDYFDLWYNGHAVMGTELQLIAKLPKRENRLSWFSTGDLNLQRFDFDTILKIVANAQPHVHELNMHGVIDLETIPSPNFPQGNPSIKYLMRLSIAQWRQILKATPPSITKVRFYGCEFGGLVRDNRLKDDELGQILDALNPEVTHLDLSYNSLNIANPNIATVLKKAFAKLKPSLRTVDLSMNDFANVSVETFLDVMSALPATVTTVKLPESFQRYSNNWSEADFAKLFTACPELCLDPTALKPVIASTWRRQNRPLNHEMQQSCKNRL